MIKISENVEKMRERIAELGQMLFDRHLTDAAGGNISARVGDVVCMSPSYSGHRHQWQLNPEDVLVTDLEGNILEGTGSISRESNVHFRLHNVFGAYGTGVMHAHPRNLLVFAAMGLSMPQVLEANLKFGEIQCIDYAPAHSVELADNIEAALRGQESRIAKHAAGIIAPWHGVFLIGKNIEAAFDAVERFDTNAYILLMAQQALGARDLMADQRAAMSEAMSRFTSH